MNIFGFKIPSFEDEFVQSDSERVLENAPASTRRGMSLNIVFQQDTEQDNEQVFDTGILPCSTEIGFGATSLFRD